MGFESGGAARIPISGVRHHKRNHFDPAYDGRPRNKSVHSHSLRTLDCEEKAIVMEPTGLSYATAREAAESTLVIEATHWADAVLDEIEPTSGLEPSTIAAWFDSGRS
jgi:hypothetical protein